MGLQPRFVSGPVGPGRARPGLVCGRRRLALAGLPLAYPPQPPLVRRPEPHPRPPPLVLVHGCLAPPAGGGVVGRQPAGPRTASRGGLVLGRGVMGLALGPRRGRGRRAAGIVVLVVPWLGKRRGLGAGLRLGRHTRLPRIVSPLGPPKADTPEAGPLRGISRLPPGRGSLCPPGPPPHAARCPGNARRRPGLQALSGRHPGYPSGLGPLSPAAVAGARFSPPRGRGIGAPPGTLWGPRPPPPPFSPPPGPHRRGGVL